MKNNIIIAGHASFVDGKLYEAPVGNFVEMLRGEGKNFAHIRHSMEGKIPSIAYFYEKGILSGEKKLPVFSKISILRYLTEITATISHLWKLKAEDGNIFIGVDPLGALPGALLKKMGKIKKFIFYTPDYSPKRFSNPILNSMYHWVDRFCVRNADYIWNVSTRIFDIRKKMGALEEKNIFLPNVPSDEYKKFVDSQKERHTLITLGKISDQLDFIGVFDALKELRSVYPDIIFKIIGNGPKEEEYKKYAKENGIENNVIFFGHLSHPEALEEISKSGIGLALYNGNWGFNYFGDSMKCREFFCFGLPVITTDTHSTVEEIKESRAGIVCPMEKEEYKKAIEKIFQNYENFSNNSRELAKKYDAIHTKLLSRLMF